MMRISNIEREIAKTAVLGKQKTVAIPLREYWTTRTTRTQSAVCSRPPYNPNLFVNPKILVAEEDNLIER
jgi:hypothetical protein